MNANEIVTKADFTQGCDISLCHTTRITQDYVIQSYEKGVQKLLNGDLDQAYLLYIESIKNDPVFPYSYMQLAKVHLARHHLNTALNLCDKALFLYPSFFDAYFLKGEILLLSEDFLSASKAFYNAVLLNKNSKDGWIGLGKSFAGIKDFTKAIQYYDRCIDLDQQNAESYFLKGNACYDLGQKEKAIDAFTSAVNFDKKHQKSFFSLAYIHQEIGEFSNAIFYYKQSLKINPSDINSLVNLGNCFQNIKEYKCAIDCCDEAISLDPTNAPIHYNKGQALYLFGKIDEAIQANKTSLYHDPSNAKAYCNLGLCYAYIGKYEDALRCYELSFDHDPSHHMAVFNISLIQLLYGDYIQGWKNYEMRFYVDPPKVILRHYPFPRLNDASVKNKHIFLYAEQGLGDTIQFCRFAKSMLELGAKVTLEVPQALYYILKTLDPRINVVSAVNQNEQFDYHQSLLSLPNNLDLTIDNIPHADGYLSVPSEKKQQWSLKLTTKKKLRIGIAWSGAILYSKDLQRSISYDMLEELWELPFEFFCLQKEIRESEAKKVHANKKIMTFCDQITDFSDTAALASEMDLIIAVDTSVAHLSGALGLKTWVLLPKVPDYRWMLEGEHSNWYSNVKIFRQKFHDDWSYVIKNVIKELQNYGNYNDRF